MTGQHSSDNVATFLQYDHKFIDRLNVSVGVRLEYYRVDDFYREAETKIFGAKVPVKPVFRGGLELLNWVSIVLSGHLSDRDTVIHPLRRSLS